MFEKLQNFVVKSAYLIQILCRGQQRGVSISVTKCHDYKRLLLFS